MAEKGSSSSRTSKPRPSSKGRGGKSAVKTPPSGTPRAKPTLYDEDSDSLARKAMRGREVEFWGIGCIALGLLLALSIYVGVAGPVGRGIETSSGWLLGLGRFALPLVALGIGIAMVRHRSIEHRARLTFGWMLIVIALLGLLHVINGADKIVADVDAMSQAGGWLGALLAEPLRSTISCICGLFWVLACHSTYRSISSQITKCHAESFNWQSAREFFRCGRTWPLCNLRNFSLGYFLCS